MNDMKRLWSHVGSLEEAIELANEFHWGISVETQDDKWIVRSGEKSLLVTNSKETLDAFLYGMGLAYSIIPDELVDKFRQMYHLEGVDD